MVACLVRVEILRNANEDLSDAFYFYEDQTPGSGSRFYRSIFKDIDALAWSGGIHPVVLGWHRALATKFPFSIYYQVEDEVVRVRAIIDCRRSPARIRRRLKRP